jgi:hypothetical protein
MPRFGRPPALQRAESRSEFETPPRGLFIVHLPPPLGRGRALSLEDHKVPAAPPAVPPTARPHPTLATLVSGAVIHTRRTLPGCTSLHNDESSVVALVRRARGQLGPGAALPGRITVVRGPRYFKLIALDALLVGPGGPTHTGLLVVPGSRTRRLFWKGAFSKAHLRHLIALADVLRAARTAFAVKSGLFERHIDAFELPELTDSACPFMFVIALADR